MKRVGILTKKITFQHRGRLIVRKVGQWYGGKSKTGSLAIFERQHLHETQDDRVWFQCRYIYTPCGKIGSPVLGKATVAAKACCAARSYTVFSCVQTVVYGYQCWGFLTFTDTDVEASDSTWGLYAHRELVDSRREKKSYVVPGKEPVSGFSIRRSYGMIWKERILF